MSKHTNGNGTTASKGGRLSATTAGAQGNQSPKDSANSGGRTSESSVHWREPRTAMEMAGQANLVATMILNRTIDLETARAYSAVVRVVAQAMSVEVARAKFTREEPDLSIPDLSVSPA